MAGRIEFSTMPDGRAQPWFVEDANGWRVAVRLAEQNGATVRAEVRFFPAEERQYNPFGEAGSWSESGENVPSGGLGRRTLIRLVEGITEAGIREALEHESAKMLGLFRRRREGERFLRAYRLDARSVRAGIRRPGKPRLDDYELARLVAGYLKVCRRPNVQAPRELYARELGITATLLSTRLTNANRRGIYVRSHGVEGGELTDYGRSILKKGRPKEPASKSKGRRR